ncbi:hypothetical protein [Pseudomonas sp. SID14000]|uniref:hypothetical protein n=1 Tax=Pseudomonas sp. SID14000 TaxID=1986221 RepID=UPI000B3BED99|nr:hypothetical protein [Pseudomonas sp. SID14000]
MSKANKRIALLLDGDYLIFEALSAAEEEVDWGEDVWTLQCDHKRALSILQGNLKHFRERLKEFHNAELVMVFSTPNGADNWRKVVLPSYKANRKGKRKPVGYPEFLKGQMADTETYYRTFQWFGLEGDDVLGILATNPEFLDVDEAIPVSCDKDFNTIPGRFYWLTQNKVVTNTEADADRWHMYQTMKGDATDGYGGIPGVGEMVGTTPLLEWLDNPTFFFEVSRVMKSGPRKGEEVWSWSSMPAEEAECSFETGITLWDCIASLARKQGMAYEDLVAQAQVARICRSSDFNWETMKPIPWQPVREPFDPGRG